MLLEEFGPADGGAFFVSNLPWLLGWSSLHGSSHFSQRV